MLRSIWKVLAELESQDKNVEILMFEILERNLVSLSGYLLFLIEILRFCLAGAEESAVGN